VALLDALAAICINEAKKQVLSLTTEGSIICIAANNGVASEIPPHLMKVFYQLKQTRSSLQLPLQEGNDKTNTPRPDKSSITYALEVQLLGDLFRFSMVKFRQRLIKRRQRFKIEFIPGMLTYAAATRSIWTKEGRVSLSICFQYVSSGQIRRLPSSLLNTAMLVTSTAVDWREMMKDEGDTSRIIQWEREIGQSLGSSCTCEPTVILWMEGRSQTTVFPLRRYLSKVFSLSNYYDALLKNVEYSFRMGTVLKKLTVEPIDPLHMTFTVNVSKSILRQVLTDSIHDNAIADDKTLGDAVLTTLDYLPGSPHFDLATQTYIIRDSHVHCEALPLRHHMLNPDLSPSNYFGVSKLCCYPCYALFSSDNTSVGPEETKYFAKGCHNKLHPLWSIPEFSEPKDSQIRFHLVQEHFAVELTELLRDKRNIHAGSDSTDASGGSADSATLKPIVDFGSYDDGCLVSSLSCRCHPSLPSSRT